MSYEIPQPHCTALHYTWLRGTTGDREKRIVSKWNNGREVERKKKVRKVLDREAQ